MYEYISGSLTELSPTYAVVEAAGVGYYINISLQTFSAIEGA
ncbi:MAG: Holliday junction branch migration protein RuvA, partial [Alistipes sp.]|nr:Holliday junction branch migration protein RuvA [Alistipes sp.]